MNLLFFSRERTDSYKDTESVFTEKLNKYSLIERLLGVSKANKSLPRQNFDLQNSGVSPPGFKKAVP